LHAKKINQKLTEAVSICLVAVISFLDLAAMIINDKFEKEIIIINLTEMRLPQNAEKVNKAVEIKFLIIVEFKKSNTWYA
jgi:hypothetical protein